MNILLPLLVLGGAALALTSSSKSTPTAGGAAPPPETDPAKRIAAAQAARRLTAAGSSDCGAALSTLPPALIDRLVKTGTGAEDLLALGDEAAKLGLSRAASCIWTSAARERIDLLASTACDERLLALPAATLKDVAMRLRNAKDQDDLQVIATSLQNNGYVDAAKCIREQAAAIAPRVAEAQRITGHKLSPSVVCDVRLFELPDAQFKAILLAVDKASSSDLVSLADGLVKLGYADAAACIRERAKDFVTEAAWKPSAPDGTADSYRGGEETPPAGDRTEETSSPFDFAPRPKKVVFGKTPSLEGISALRPVDQWDKMSAGISNVDLRNDTAAILRSLETFKSNLAASRYTVKELTERAADVRVEAPDAAARILDAALLINILRNWPEFTPPNRFFEEASRVLSGLRLSGSITESINGYTGWDRRADLYNLIDKMEKSGVEVPPRLRSLRIAAIAGDVSGDETARTGSTPSVAARNRINVEF